MQSARAPFLQKWSQSKDRNTSSVSAAASPKRRPSTVRFSTRCRRAASSTRPRSVSFVHFFVRMPHAQSQARSSPSMADGQRTERRRGTRVKKFLCFLILLSLMGSASFAAPARTFTPWGWPQPYDQVSQKSIDWLKSKGYWPLSVAWTGPWSGEDSIATAMEHLQLLQKRGVEAKYTEYIGGPPINESMLAGRSQVGFEGNFPFTTL